MSVCLKNWQIIASEFLVLFIPLVTLWPALYSLKKNKTKKRKQKTQKIKKRKGKETKREKWRRVSQRVALEFSKRLNYVVLSRYSNAKIPCSLCITCHCLLMLKNFTLINVLTM